ncbi:hypothetical protein ACFL60_06230 [Candidatus Omnitrophota bacterium]
MEEFGRLMTTAFSAVLLVIAATVKSPSLPHRLTLSISLSPLVIPRFNRGREKSDTSALEVSTCWMVFPSLSDREGIKG